MPPQELETYSDLELMMSDTVGSPYFAKGRVNGEPESRYFEFYERYFIRNVWQTVKRAVTAGNFPPAV